MKNYVAYLILTLMQFMIIQDFISKRTCKDFHPIISGHVAQTQISLSVVQRGVCEEHHNRSDFLASLVMAFASEFTILFFSRVIIRIVKARQLTIFAYENIKILLVKVQLERYQSECGTLLTLYFIRATACHIPPSELCQAWAAPTL